MLAFQIFKKLTLKVFTGNSPVRDICEVNKNGGIRLEPTQTLVALKGSKIKQRDKKPVT